MDLPVVGAFVRALEAHGIAEERAEIPTVT
jgi:hypothetical protein